MNEKDDCMVELVTHKTENSGHVSSVFIHYLYDKYGLTTTEECVEELS
jgi:hypothetical protein